jgi:hypothetical protein
LRAETVIFCGAGALLLNRALVGAEDRLICYQWRGGVFFAPAAPFSLVHPRMNSGFNRNSFSKFCVVQISDHSPFTFAWPRNKN